MYKNQLQELAQRSCFNLPSYTSLQEGPDHAPRFKAIVNFNGKIFKTPHYCSTLRQAEHSAAEVTLNSLTHRGPSHSLAAKILMKKPQEEEEDQISEGLKKIKGSNNRFFTVGLVAAWYSSNIGVLLLNKYLLNNYGLKYPIFLTMCHMTTCSLFSYVAIAWMKVVPLQTLRSRVQFFKISVLSLVFYVSVVFRSISLYYLPVSFNQAIGATTPFFTAVFAYLMTLKRETWLTYLTLVPVVTGVILASGGESSFHLFGFIICVAATAARALKSVLQGIYDFISICSISIALYVS
ncbi:probable sugar phosphate/phosphate translocator At5g05820 [Glycine max]|uniref:probable sugar phosphate/phosphate translocator At5g05820 n=1 Tax=Glycine max TaxID=3847 RepID=UPI000233DC6E|nr:probable sugar phosphate/phosphate translocator At5g05820 [Glycine max]|eukprot:XP_003556842.1 probable sugar phosphate/phosphate translocator At5g05820 [Glycine max]